MRITEGLSAANLLFNLQSTRAKAETLQNQASTGLKISGAGDDPVIARRIVQMKGLVAENSQYSRNITNADAWLNGMDGVMGEMTNIMTRVQELSVGMSTGTYDAKARTAAAEEVKQLKDQLISLGNSQVGGRYVFGGFVTDKPPFDTTKIANPPPDPLNGTGAGTYIGTEDDIIVSVDRASTIPINYSGGKLLRGSGGGTDIIATLDTLITALGTNNVTGVRNSLTNIEAGKNQVLAARGEIGARMNRLESSSSKLEIMKLGMEKVLSGDQDIDFVQVISDLQRQQTALQSAMQSAAKIQNLSLLDYLK